MSDKTLGRIAYETWAEAALGKGWAFFPWDDLSDQDGWEAAAQAVAAEVASHGPA